MIFCKHDLKPFSEKLHPEDVTAIIDFGAARQKLQSEGVAGLYNILCDRHFAYLADEVGMGKTMQAIGICALVWKLKPDARICVIAPRGKLQLNWQKEYLTFVQKYYTINDNIVRDTITHSAVCRPELPSNLREFVPGLCIPSPSLHILKRTSFMRPVFLTENIPQGGKKLRDVLDQCGLECPQKIRMEERNTFKLNELFGKSVGLFLNSLTKEPFFDLLIIDEAQYLRNEANQTNTVLRNVFGCPETEVRSNVGRWLFLSATPLHTGTGNIDSILKNYLGEKVSVVNDNDPSAIRSALKPFLIRRCREISGKNQRKLRKNEYREHFHKQDSIPSPQYPISVVACMAMGLVQKKLVHLLKGKGYRYNLGLLSSFETLSDTMYGDQTDFEKIEYHDTSSSDAPDALMIQTLNNEFQSVFNMRLPHPKLEAVVIKLAELAFMKGEKVLVFSRRVNTVYALRRRLLEAWMNILDNRIKSLWNDVQFSWEYGPGAQQQLQKNEGSSIPSGTDDDDMQIDVPGAELYQTAGSEGKWLQLFRRKFNKGGSFELFFEENWICFFHRFLFAGNICFEDLLEKIYDCNEVKIVLKNAMHLKLKSGRITRLQRIRYCELQIIKLIEQGKIDEVLCKNDIKLREFITFLDDIFTDESRIHTISGSQDKQEVADRGLIEHKGFWEIWNETNKAKPEALPGIDFKSENNSFYLRQIAKNCLSQVIRLSDRAIDLACAQTIADIQAKDGMLKLVTMAELFITRCFINSTELNNAFNRQVNLWCDPEAVALVVQNCLREEDDSDEKIAVRGKYTQLFGLSPVAVITGQTDQNANSIPQFNTPFYPNILVCTDVLKEGENLHLFCDRICHYGIAWTAGDLEQRVGRIDRFDSLVERKIKKNEDSKLMIHYPHITNTIEKGQIDVVIDKIRRVEETMDFSIQTTMNGKGDSEVVAGDELNFIEHPNSDDLTSGSNFFEPNFEGIPLNERLSTIIRRKCEGIPFEVETNIKKVLSDNIIHKQPMIAQTKDRLISFYWTTGIPSSKCYAIKVVQDVTDDAETENEISTCFEIIDQEPKQFVSQRFVFDTSLSNEICKDIASFYKKESPIIDNDPEKYLKSILPDKMVMHSTEKQHKWRLDISNIGPLKRSQSILLYFYKRMILITSPIAKSSAITIPSINEQNGKNNLKLKEWISKTNRKLSLGYLFLRSEEGGDMLYFSEKIFQKTLKEDQIRGIITHIAVTADVLEMYLTAQDDN